MDPVDDLQDLPFATDMRSIRVFRYVDPDDRPYEVAWTKPYVSDRGSMKRMKRTPSDLG